MILSFQTFPVPPFPTTTNLKRKVSFWSIFPFPFLCFTNFTNIIAHQKQKERKYFWWHLTPSFIFSLKNKKKTKVERSWKQNWREAGLSGANGGWDLVDSTSVLPILDVEISRVSPSSSPGVTNDPSLVSLNVSRVSSELDAVVNGSSTGSSSNYSSLIVLPGSCINLFWEKKLVQKGNKESSKKGKIFYANRDWSSGLDVSEHSSLVSSSNIAPSVDFCSNVGWVVSAASVLSGVRVGGVGINSSSGLDVLVCEVGPSSVASVAAGVTVNNLLHSEVWCRSPGSSLSTIKDNAYATVYNFTIFFLNECISKKGFMLGILCNRVNLDKIAHAKKL